MSAGSPEIVSYESGSGLFFPISIQPETQTLTLNSVANAAPANPIGAGLPSASVSRGRRSNGVNARLVRFRFNSATTPPGYKVDGTLTVPVLQAATFAAYGKGQTGTYTLNGTDYSVAFVGKTPETIV